MSLVTNETTPESSTPNADGGLDIDGFDNAPNALNGSGGNDNVMGGSLNDTIDAGLGNDDVVGGGGDDLLGGSGGDDSVDGGDGQDFGSGGSGNDIIMGGAGTDVLFGGTGADTLNGGDGSDVLIGGLGADTFQFNVADSGVDRILDFDPTQDMIELGGISPADVVTYDAATGIIAVNGNSVANIGKDLTIDTDDFGTF